MSRRPLMMGNWKMNLGAADAVKLAENLREIGGASADGPQAVLCPSFLHLPQVASIMAGTFFEVGGQDCVAQAPGAVTGGTSGEQLVESGAKWVILGHSERRAIFAESDALLSEKLAAAFRVGLRPVLCVGETLAQREADRTVEVVAGQLRGALSDLPAEQAAAVTIAYEPVWAIGTGRNAEIDDVAKVHSLVRSLLAESFDESTAQIVRVLYGGSVTEKNIATYMTLEDVDGALVGGASLDATRFTAILNYQREA